MPPVKLTTPRLDENTWLFRNQKDMDERLGRCASNCGGNTWCNYIVGSQQLEGFPRSTLLIARVSRVVLAVFICFCVIGLITGFFLEGSMDLLEEIETRKEMALPNLAICPQPWGATFVDGKVKVATAEMIEIPGGKKAGQVEYEGETCPSGAHGVSRLTSCTCINMAKNIVKPHGKRGELDFWDYAQLTMLGNNKGVSNQWAVGFYSQGMNPQQWSYITQGHMIETDVRIEEVATGKTEFTDGDSVPRFTMAISGDAVNPGGATIFTFGYNKYESFVMSSFTSQWSFFAMMTLLITFCAAVNNFGLFDIAFPEKSETAQLEPNVCFRLICGPCCICCNEEEEADEEKGTAEKESDPLLKSAMKS